jgi:hypothetical protein
MDYTYILVVGFGGVRFMWKKLLTMAVLGVFLDWATTTVGLASGLCVEIHPAYSPVWALTILTSLSLLSYWAGKRCTGALRTASTIVAFSIAGCGYLAALNNAVVIMLLTH